jgi:DNA (cytosine-5)-methyltransferase 1
MRDEKVVMMRFASFFSGIGAPECAWADLGWECAAVAEIDKAAADVLRHHYPALPNLGDIEAITEDRIAALGPLDLIVGGFPCQDVSVAGKRKGLIDADGKTTRSGIFFAAMRLVRTARRRCGLRWLVVENVPGLLSNNDGRDFGTVVAEICGAGFDVPRNGWGNSGAAAGPDGLVEWATLDARYRGLAQRRERVFLVADFGDWPNRAPVLLERESMCGNPPPCREARENVAGTVGARTEGRGGLGTDFDCDGGLVMVSHTLRGEGFDASEDGTGRGVPLVFDPNQITSAKNCSQPKPGGPCHALPAQAQGPLIAFTCKDYGQDMQHDIAPTLRAMNEEGGHANAGGQVAVAIPILHEAFTLAIRGRGDSCDLEWRQDGTSNALLTPTGGRGGAGVGAVATKSAVRRLLPVECEALQGFPTGWTEFKASPKGPVRQKDGPRYKQLGNAMAVPVMRYIGERIEDLAT